MQSIAPRGAVQNGPMTIYGKDSGTSITAARVRDFRSLADVEVSLNDLTVLIGSNKAGKTSFLDALFAAIGAGRKSGLCINSPFFDHAHISASVFHLV